MPYYRFLQDQGTSDDIIVKAEDLRAAWHKTIDEITDDDDLQDVQLAFEDEVEMPAGFEDESANDGKEEGSKA